MALGSNCCKFGLLNALLSFSQMEIGFLKFLCLLRMVCVASFRFFNNQSSKKFKGIKKLLSLAATGITNSHDCITGCTVLKFCFRLQMPTYVIFAGVAGFFFLFKHVVCRESLQIGILE